MKRGYVPSVHNCELTLKSDLALPSFLPPIVRSSNWFEKWKLWCLMSEKHPECSQWVDSRAAITKERKRQCHLPNWWIIHPFSPVRFVWEIVMTLVYALALGTIPFMTSFVVFDYELVRLDRLNLVFYGFFWLDIVVNSVTGVVSKKKKTINLRQASIIKCYLKGFLLIDVLTSLPYDHITYKWRRTAGRNSNGLVAVINLIPLLKISRYPTFHSYVSRLFVHLQISDFTYQMFSTLVLSLYIIHWFACFCYVIPVVVMYILRITVDECSDCWVTNISGEDVPSRYRHALFIVVQNFVASGFGAIEPRTEGHTIVCTVLMILGRIFEGYIVIMFLQIKAGSRGAESKYQEITNQLSAYTRQKQLPPYMKRRLFAYYHYRFRNSYFREKTILSSLSGIRACKVADRIVASANQHRANTAAALIEQLRQEILLHSCRRLIENVAVFRALPRHVLGSIVANLKFELYLPNDVIVKAGTQGDCMYFLASGTVAVLTPTGKEVCHLDDGAHFGEVALLVPDQRRVASVLAIEVCEVYRLDRKDFRKCIATHSDLFAKIEQIATDRMERTVMIEEQHKRFLMNARRAMSMRRGRGRPGR